MERDRNEQPPRMRHVHVVVPERAYQRARSAAVFANMPFKHFMARLMDSAQPEGAAGATDSATAGRPVLDSGPSAGQRPAAPQEQTT